MVLDYMAGGGTGFIQSAEGLKSKNWGFPEKK